MTEEMMVCGGSPVMPLVDTLRQVNSEQREIIGHILPSFLADVAKLDQDIVEAVSILRRLLELLNEEVGK